MNPWYYRGMIIALCLILAAVFIFAPYHETHEPKCVRVWVANPGHLIVPER